MPEAARSPTILVEAYRSGARAWNWLVADWLRSVGVMRLVSSSPGIARWRPFTKFKSMRHGNRYERRLRGGQQAKREDRRPTHAPESEYRNIHCWQLHSVHGIHFRLANDASSAVLEQESCRVSGAVDVPCDSGGSLSRLAAPWPPPAPAPSFRQRARHENSGQLVSDVVTPVVRNENECQVTRDCRLCCLCGKLKCRTPSARTINTDAQHSALRLIRRFPARRSLSRRPRQAAGGGHVLPVNNVHQTLMRSARWLDALMRLRRADGIMPSPRCCCRWG